jgi:hypothetical protein
VWAGGAHFPRLPPPISIVVPSHCHTDVVVVVVVVAVVVLLLIIIVVDSLLIG